MATASHSIRVLTLLGLVGLASAPAAASFSPVRDSGSEATVKEIFAHYFDPTNLGFVMGADTGSMGAAHEWYTFGGGTTATRVHDYGAGHTAPIDLLSGSTSNQDTTWTDGIANFTAEARFAGYSQSFGIDSTPGNGVDHSAIFAASGNGFTDDGLTGGAGPLNLSGVWAWTRDGSGVGPWSSNSSDNSDDKDHMITYLIDDGSGDTVWWLFFEDLDGLGDGDYNDLAVEVRAQPVPVPSAVALAAVGLSVVGLVRRRLA